MWIVNIRLLHCFKSSAVRKKKRKKERKKERKEERTKERKKEMV
jgi:hypothetical protein